MTTARATGFVGADNLTWQMMSRIARLDGQVSCLGGLLLTVEKVLRRRDDHTGEVVVETIKYSYTASVRGHSAIFRYDNAHVHPGHATPHHRHGHNWRTGKETSLACVGDDWPLLSNIIDELHKWFEANRTELPSPNDFAKIDDAYAARQYHDA